MSEDRREAHVRQYLEEVFNGHDLSRLDKYLDADLASHWLGDRTLHGLTAWKEAMGAFFAAFPDAAYSSRTSSSPATRAFGGGPGAARSAEIGKASRQRAGRRPGP